MNKIIEPEHSTKKKAKIKELSEQLGGVKSKYLELDRKTTKDFASLTLTKIQENKKELKKMSSEMNKLKNALKSLGVEIDLEQR